MKYLLNKKPLSERSKFKVTIVGDSNDADYITTINTYSKEDFEEYVLSGLTELDKYKSHHELKDFVLKELTVEYIDESGEIWDVELLGGEVNE